MTDGRRASPDRAPAEAGTAGMFDAAPVVAFQLCAVAAVLAVLVVDGIDIQLLGLVSPLIIAEWGIGSAAFGPAVAAALIGMAVGAGIGGAVGDRIGRRTTLVLAVLLFGAATAAVALTSHVHHIVLLRLIGGTGFGAAGPNGLALVSEWLPGRLRAQAISLMSIGTPAGGMLASFVIVALLPPYGWRGTFVGCGLATLVLGAVILLFVRESPTFLIARGRYDAAERAMQRVAGAVAPAAGDAMAPRPSAQGWSSLFDRENLRLSLGTGIGFFAASVISYAFAAWTTLLLTRVGFTLVQALAASFAFNLAAVVAAATAGFLIRRFGSRAILCCAAASLAVAIALLGAAIAGIGRVPSVIERALIDGVFGLVGGLAGAAMAAIYAIMAFGYPAECRATGIGFGMMLGRAGGIATTFLGASLLDRTAGGIGWLLLILCGNAIMLLAMAVIVDRHLPARRSR